MKRLDFLLYRARHSAKLVGPLCIVLLTAMFAYSGALFPDSIPDRFSSSDELLGQVLLLILTPAFLLTYLVVAERRSVGYAEQLATHDLVSTDPAAALQKIRGRNLLFGAVPGFLYGLLVNLPPELRNSFGSIGIQLQSIAIGQLLLWTLTGVVLAYRLHTASCFHDKGKVVPLDLYDTRKCESFARNGLDDVFAITVLLVLTTLQSIDAQFRLDNYINAWLIALPAGAALLILPMWSLHRRLLARKQQFLEEMRRQVADAPRAADPSSLIQIELLMQHRDRISRTSTWPIDFSIASQLFLYIIIPPVAWLGAAFVEVGLDRILSDP